MLQLSEDWGFFISGHIKSLKLYKGARRLLRKLTKGIN